MKDHKPQTGIVPPQTKGRKTSAEAHAEAADREEAMLIYQEARRRLLDINRWDKYAGSASSTFSLTDAGGNPVDRIPEVGDLIKIDLPGPGSVSGDGYDWVQIEEYVETIDRMRDNDLFAFRVRPHKNPASEEENPAHFYTDEATSTFLIKRAGTKVTAAEKGRNEIPNMEADRLLDKVRNAAVGVGASLGLAIPQWKALMEGLLKNDNEIIN